MPILLPDPHEKGNDFVNLIEMDARDRRDAIRMQKLIRDLYYGMKLRKLRYKGQSDIHLYVMAEKIDGIVAKEMNAFFAMEPHANISRVPAEFNEKETLANERFVNWAVDSDVPNFYKKFECWLRNRHLDSVSVMKVWYNYQTRFTNVDEEAETIWRQGSLDLVGLEVPEDRAKVPYEILAGMFANLEITDARRGKTTIDPLKEQELEGLSFVINFEENRIAYEDIKVIFKPCKYVDTIVVTTHRPIVVKDNVEVGVVDFEDLIVPFRTEDLQIAPRLAHKYWLTLSQIEQKINFENWDITEEEFEILKSKRGIEDRQEELADSNDSLLKEQKDLVTKQRAVNRTTSGHKFAPYSDDKILIFEVYATDDLDGDGVPEEVVYQIPYSLKKVVRAHYLEELFPHGHRPFADIYSIPISNRFYGWSIGQLLVPINLEVDAVINSVNDAQEVINNPWFFYTPVAFNPDEKIPRNLIPGQGVPCNDPSGLFFPTFNQQPLANLFVIDSLLLYADKTTISPQSLGSSQVRNAPRTARGTLALLSEGATRVDNFIMAAQKGGWAELMYQIYALYDANASDDLWYQVTGYLRPPRQDAADRRRRIKFTFKGNTVNTNREVMRTMAQVIYNTLLLNPLYAQDPQALLAVTEFFLRHFQDVGNVQALLPRIQPGIQRSPMDQNQEIQLIAQGVPIDVLPMDDHAGHLKQIFAFQGSSQFKTWNPHQVALLAAHAAQHQRGLMLQSQQGQLMQETAASQSNNMALQLGNLEGGIS